MISRAKSDVVRDERNAGSTVEAGCGFPEPPRLLFVHALPEFIWLPGTPASTIRARPSRVHLGNVR
jgi:hypothetical protein